MGTRQRQEDRLRSLVAQECAKILANEGIADFLIAKRKASARLGISGKSYMPTNLEIEQALLEYQRLFHGRDQSRELRQLRESALEAMQFLKRFQPRLTGQVLSGTANQHSVINLHLFADTPEDVILFFMEHNIPFETAERRLRYPHNEYAYFPVITFQAGEASLELTIFNPQKERSSPRSPVDGKPMQRASIAEVKQLLIGPAHA